MEDFRNAIKASFVDLLGLYHNLDSKVPNLDSAYFSLHENKDLRRLTFIFYLKHDEISRIQSVLHGFNKVLLESLPPSYREARYQVETKFSHEAYIPFEETVNDLEKQIKTISVQYTGLDQSTLNDSKNMTIHYFKIYCLENFIRKYIKEGLEPDLQGDNTISSYFPTTLNEKIAKLKKNELYLWLTERGDSDIYMTDFIDLAKILDHNQNWEIIGKNHKITISDAVKNSISNSIKEIYKLRCKIMHSSLPLSMDEIKILEGEILKLGKQIGMIKQ